MKSKKIVIELIPFFAVTLISAVALAVYLTVLNGASVQRILLACIAPLVPLVIPAVNRLFKFRIPFSFNVAVSAFAVAGIIFASVLDFYHLIPYYDKFLHTTFGVLGAFGVFIVLLHGSGKELKPWCFFLVIFLCVMGVAALWEVFEYATGAVFSESNPQNWRPDMNKVGNMTVREFFKTYNPLTDTMWDIIAAAGGVLIFYLIIFTDKLRGYKLSKSIDRQISGESVKLTDENI